MDRPARQLSAAGATRGLAGGAALAALALLAAGCGGSSPRPGLASLSGTTGSTLTAPGAAPPAATTPAAAASTGALAAGGRYAGCMRSHGVPGFPEPVASAGGVRVPVASASGADRDSPAFVPAARACARLLPGESGSGAGSPLAQARLEQRVRDLLAFSRCMRAHGVANFPDPTSAGSYELDGSGINQYSAGVLAAGKACLASARGAIPPPGHQSSGAGP